jgi:hypothetical protein
MYTLLPWPTLAHGNAPDETLFMPTNRYAVSVYTENIPAMPPVENRNIGPAPIQRSNVDHNNNVPIRENISSGDVELHQSSSSGLSDSIANTSSDNLLTFDSATSNLAADIRSHTFVQSPLEAMSINTSVNTSSTSSSSYRLQSDSAASASSGGRVLGGGESNGVRLIGGSLVSINPRRNGYSRINDSDSV